MWFGLDPHSSRCLGHKEKIASKAETLSDLFSARCFGTRCCRMQMVEDLVRGPESSTANVVGCCEST